MDGSQFDELTRTLSLSRLGARRGLLRALAAAPLLGGLAARLGEEEAEAKRRRKHGPDRGDDGVAAAGKNKKRRKKKRKRKKKKCKKRRKTVCTGRCGQITFTCNKRKQTVACDPCTCQPACQNPTPICVGNTCAACSAEHPCPNGLYCDGEQCLPCDVCASGSCDFSSVQAAIDAADANTTLHICPGAYGRITFNTSLTLIGAGQGNDPASNTILDAKAEGPTVSNPADMTTTLQALRITGGKEDFGGGVRNSGVLTLHGCTVASNEASDGGGGGLLNELAGVLTLTDCTVTNNRAPGGFGGGISHASNGSLTLVNSTITNNSAGGGGGINQLSNGALTLDGVTISLNTAQEFAGGGILLNAGPVHVTNGSAITQNTAKGDGGGLWVAALGTVTFDSTTSVTRNTGADAGGIYLDDGGTVTLNGATVTDNTPNDCVGLTC